jgi:hypothetical protein
LALAVIALALSASASAEVICALALATNAGIAEGVLLSASAIAFSGAFRLSEDFETRVYLRWA